MDQKSNNSNFSFDSDKLIDGYNEFMLMSRQRQMELAEQQAAQEAGKQEYAKFMKAKKEKKKRAHKKHRTSRPLSTNNSSQHSRGSSLSLTACYNCCANGLVNKVIHKDDAEFDLNISFSGGYVPNTDLIRVDKGQGNP